MTLQLLALPALGHGDTGTAIRASLDPGLASSREPAVLHFDNNCHGRTSSAREIDRSCQIQDQGDAGSHMPEPIPEINQKYHGNFVGNLMQT